MNAVRAFLCFFERLFEPPLPSSSLCPGKNCKRKKIVFQVLIDEFFFFIRLSESSAAEKHEDVSVCRESTKGSHVEVNRPQETQVNF